MIQKINVIVFSIFAALLFSSCTSEEKLTVIYDRVSIYAEEGKAQEAIDLLKNEVPTLNRDYKYYFFLGFLYAHRENSRLFMREANENFMKAYKHNPSKYNNTYLLARTFEDIQDFTNAKKYFNRAIEIWETTDIRNENFIEEPYFSYALFLVHERDFDLAFEYIEKSLVENENNPDAILLKGFILTNVGNDDDLAVYYEKALELSPNEPKLKRDYGKMLIELGEYQKAYDFFSTIKNDATLTEVDHYFAKIELVYLELLNGNYDVALLYLQETKGQTSDYLPPFKYLTFYEWKIKDYNDSYNSYKLYRRTAEDLESVEFDAEYTNTTELLEYFKDDPYFKKLNETNPPFKNKTSHSLEEPILKRDYGKTLIELGEYQKALDFFLEIKNDATLTELDHYYAKVELSYLELLNKNYDAALLYLTDASDDGFSHYLPYRKYRTFYHWAIQDSFVAYDWYKLYRFLAEDLESVEFDGDYTNIAKFLEYFKDDPYFQKLKETKETVEISKIEFLDSLTEKTRKFNEFTDFQDLF